MAESHQSGPRRLISRSSSAPGMMPWYAARQLSSCVAAIAGASDGLARRTSIRVVLMRELKRSTRLSSRDIFNSTLTMWIDDSKTLWNESGNAKKSRQHRCLARCCRRATLVNEILAAAQRYRLLDWRD